MKITLEPTESFVAIPVDEGRGMMGLRIWKGVTEGGIAVVIPCYGISAVDVAKDDEALAKELPAFFTEPPRNFQSVEVIPLRRVI